jgi:hypothetical protein
LEVGDGAQEGVSGAGLDHARIGQVVEITRTDLVEITLCEKANDFMEFYQGSSPQSFHNTLLALVTS